MSSLSGCMHVVGHIDQGDADRVIESLDRYMEAGIEPVQAQRQAVADLLAEIAADKAEFMGLVREQHADLFKAPEVKPKPAQKRELLPQPSARELAHDAEQQQAWLNDRAQAEGWRDIDALVDNDFDGFMALAEQWRDRNPAEVLLSRANQTETPAFRKWFDESKVVDDKGKPLVVYHGSHEALRRMKSAAEMMREVESDVRGASLALAVMERDRARRLGAAMWFTDSESVADGYSDQRERAPDKTVREGWLSILNPLDLRPESSGLNEVQRHLTAALGPDGEIALDYGADMGVAQAIIWDNTRVIEYARGLGYDGLIYPDTDVRGRGVHTSYVTFEQGQFKDKGNKGTFDRRDGDIFLSRAVREHGIPSGATEIHSARDTKALKAHPDYVAAKAGDMAAAARLVQDLVRPNDLAIAKASIGPGVQWAYAHAEEATGRNMIPAMMVARYAAFTAGEVATPIVQINRAFHTGADAMQRMIARPLFEGAVTTGASYALVDDVTTMGGTLAELSNHIQQGGGKVVAVVTLANAGRAPIMAAGRQQIAEIERRHGQALRDTFHIAPGALTRDEAGYVLGFRDADALGNRAVAAERARSERLWAKGISAEDQGLTPKLSRPATGYHLREFGAAGMTIEALQDRYNRWKSTIEDVVAQGGVLTEASDFYRAEERYWGKVASRIEDFDGELANFIKAVAKDKITLADVQEYAYAKHAHERNEYLRSKREADARTGFDSWSGMTDDDAQAIIDQARLSGTEAALEAHRQTLQQWIKGTRDLMLSEGLITPEQHATLSTFYKDYVPLRGHPNASKPAGNGTGQGFNIRGKETTKAKGRYSEADNIIEHIAADRVRVLIRSGKNEVLRSFLQFVIGNPDPALWEINATQTKPVFKVDANGDQVIEDQKSVVSDDRTVAIKDGGREVFVLIKDDKLREQMKGLNAEQVGASLGHMLAAQRTLGRLYTSLNPVFTVTNFARDVLASTMGMVGEVGIKGAAKLWAELPGALKQAWLHEFGGRAGADYQLFRATGGKTGFMNFQDIDTLAKNFEKQLKNADRSAWNPLVFAPAALDVIEGINAVLENATRFASWKAARSEGKTLAQASSISKNISVNFDRKGTMTTSLSAWFMFFNPAVQGTARIMQALKDPKTLAVLGAGMTGVAMLALQNASMGDDDDGVAWWDKIPQSYKDRNLIIVLPPGSTAGEAVPGSQTGRYIKIPMPYGWNWFATIANQAADMWRHAVDPARGVKPTKAMTNVATSFLEAFLPSRELAGSTSESRSAVMAAVPDFLNAPAQSILNMTAFGKPMYPQDSHNENLPDSGKYFAGQSGTIFQRGAEFLNEHTGGNKYKKGALDFTPATLENLVRSYGGGPASFTLDIMNAMYVRQSIERPDLDVARLPFVKQLYGRIDAETDRVLGYERMGQIKAVVEPIEAARRHHDIEPARAMAQENPEMYQLGGALKTVSAQLSVLRKEEIAIIASDESEGSKFARLQLLAERKRKVMQNLNRAFNDASRREGERETATAN